MPMGLAGTAVLAAVEKSEQLRVWPLGPLPFRQAAIGGSKIIALQDMRLRLVLLGRNDQVVPNHGVLVEHENMGGRIGLRDSSDKQVRRGGLERIKLRFGRLVVRG